VQLLILKGGGTLWFSLGPSTIVEDKVTSLVCSHMEATYYRGLISAASSGVCAALCVTSQIEHLITASHARGLSMNQTIYSIYTAKGISGIMLPPGMLAMVGREVPFASALFYFRPLLSEYLNEKFPTVKNNEISLSRELLCGCLTSIVATPLSHPSSVIAAYQQGHSVSPTAAFREITALDGWTGLWRGLAARTVSLAGTFTVVPILLYYLSPISRPDH
jgi:hypothetical protein